MRSRPVETPVNSGLLRTRFGGVFGQGRKRANCHLCQGLDPRPADAAHAARRHARLRQTQDWRITLKAEEVASGAKIRPRREELLRAARRKEIDTIVVWRLDRWGRSLVDLVITLQELVALKVGFVSLSEALDLTTPSGRAFAGMLAVFAEFERDILRDRVKAGIAQARKDGRPHGRPVTVGRKAQEIKKLTKRGLSKSAIARKLNIGRTSVRRLLTAV
jgi:putative DNA-invertase from lambdoid prophage Rac